MLTCCRRLQPSGDGKAPAPAAPVEAAISSRIPAADGAGARAVDVPAKSESVMETSPGLVQNRARMTDMLA